MINNDRRNFIFKSSMLAASGVLTACGGGGATPGIATAGAAPAATEPAAVTGDTQLAAGQVVAIPGTPLPNATIRLSGDSTVRAAPYCLGYAFRLGDVPVGKALTGSTGTIQVIPKNLWPDGSLKFAVIAGQADITAAVDTNIALMLIPAPSTTPGQLTTAKLRATEIVAEVGCGTYGSVKWTGADWDAPFQTWVQGPVMSSWIYRKAVGTDKHLVAWLEVRLWASGAVEVLPWIENGYLRVAAPTNKSATFTFTLGKTQRMSAAIDLKHHQRTPLISGSALSYWLATDPGVTARHNTAYLQATELVPTYQAVVSASSTAVSRLPVTYMPLQAGSFNFDGDSMASSGYQDPIGLLPQHDVLYLTSDAKIAHAAVIRNGFSAGRYALHYRDESTNRPLRFSSYPTLVIGSSQGFKDNGGSTTNSRTPTPTGGNGPGWDTAHSPSVGYLAYLVTGRWYFMEEVQFATTANYLGNGDHPNLRSGSKGLVKPEPGAWQTRSCAWDWRARVQALCVTPDADIALRSEFIASVEANIEYFHARYIAQPNNPFGWIRPGEEYGTTSLRMGAPWQQDFVTAAFGYSVSLDLPIATAAKAKLAAFFQWKARSAVMRLGPKGTFWYVNAAPYTVEITPSNSPDYANGTGPWHESDAAVYNATYAGQPAWMGKVDGTLAAELLPGADSMWGNLLPAIAYAVRHNVPGAQDAYNRIISASNWPALRDQLNVRPVWSVKPAGGTPVAPPVIAPVQPATNPGAPAWASSAPLNAWMEIPGTAGAGGTQIESFSGWVKLPNGKIAIALAGGHSDGTKNSVAVIDMLANAPAWVEVSPESPTHTYEVAYEADGKPACSHTYYTTMWIPATNRLMRFGAMSVPIRGGTYYPTVDGFNFVTNKWDAAGTYANLPTGTSGAGYNPVTGKVLTIFGTKYYDPVTGVTTNVATGNVQLPRAPWVWDSRRGQMFGLCYGDNQEASLFLGICAAVVKDGVMSQISIAPSAAAAQFAAEVPASNGMDYDPVNDCFLAYAGIRSGAAGRVYKIKPNNTLTWDMEIFSYGIGGVLPIGTSSSGLMSKFSYIPELKGFVMMARKASNLYFMRSA
jgi:hypothetical protein